MFNSIVEYYDVAFRIYMRLYSKLAPATQATTLFGTRFNCLRADFIQRRIAFFGLFEPNLTYYLLSVLRPGDVFVDVGANIGYFTLLASTRVESSGKVYAIEASPSTYALLMANLKLNAAGNVDAINMAVADKECRVRMHIVDSKNIGANSIKVVSDDEPDSVIGRPLRDIVGDDLFRAKVIKVDVEGAEGLILPAIFDALAEHNSGAILVSEISDENTHLIELAKAKGFTVQALRNNYTISYLLIRAFLRRYDEGDFHLVRPVDAYVTNQYDYVFTRGDSERR